MILDVQSLTISVGSRVLVKDASFTIERGEFVGIIGPNGAGKTTLLKSLRGLHPLAGGNVVWNGQPLASMTDSDIARIVAYMQQSVSVQFDFTARDVVIMARYPYLKWYEQEGPQDSQIVEQAMTEVGVWHLKDRPIQSLSGGERQRVMLAKALAQQTEVLLLDEPTASLDLVYADDIFHQSRQLCDKGRTIFIVVHDLELAAKYCTKLLLVANGMIQAIGTPRDVLTADNLKTAFNLNAAVYDDPYYPQQRIYVFPREAAMGAYPISPNRTIDNVPINGIDNMSTNKTVEDVPINENCAE